MSSSTRLLCLMGSGETAPPLAAVHADLMRRVDSPPGLALMLDTPYGFQENADEISARARSYFRVSVGHPLEIGSLRDRDTADPVSVERLYNQLRDARYIFVGPGSPSYTLRQWRGLRVPELIAAQLTRGGCSTFASAAAIVLGRFALPVYEIYKVGEPAHWIDGLDLLAPLGLDVVVIPHYDNTEGGTHDTRYCYMGERRMRQLEQQLPDGIAILGVAEHTAAIIDLEAQTLEVRGRGFVALRRHGIEHHFEPGPPIHLDQLRRGAGGIEVRPGPGPIQAADRHRQSSTAITPFEAAEHQRRAFERALERSDADAALAALLALDDQLVSWAADTLSSDAFERARSTYRGMLVRLVESSRRGLADPNQVVAPFVELALRVRDEARREQRYLDADLVRAALAELQVEVRDTPSGTEWSLTARPDGFDA